MSDFVLKPKLTYNMEDCLWDSPSQKSAIKGHEV